MNKDRFLNEIIEGKPRKHKGGAVSISEQVPPNKISKVLGQVMHWFNRTEIQTPDECAERLNEYFKTTYESGSLPVMEEMALALGTTRDMMLEWEVKKTKGKDVSRMIHKAKEMLASMDAKLASQGAIYHATYQFRAKNYYHMKDQQDFKVEASNPLGEGKSAKELSAEYLDSLPQLEGEEVDG